MEVVKVVGLTRKSLGKKASKAARKEGQIPGVLYGGDEVIHFSTTKADLKSAVYTADFKTIDLEIDGKNYNCILKDIQFHPITDNIQHIDLLRLFDGVSVSVEVPVKFTGVSPGVVGGGKLIQSVRKVKLKTIPEALVDHVTIDISELELGSAVRIKDIKELENVQIMNVPGTPVASVEIPRALKSAESEEEGGEGGEETAPEEGGEASAES